MSKKMEEMGGKNQGREEGVHGERERERILNRSFGGLFTFSFPFLTNSKKREEIGRP